MTSPPVDGLIKNTTKISSVNPSGTLTVTSLPLTHRHLQDVQFPSQYDLLFDLVAHQFSKSTLRGCSSQQIAPSSKAAIRLAGSEIPAFSGTKSREVLLTPQGCEHRGRGCPKSSSCKIKLAALSPPIEEPMNSPVQQQRRYQTFPSNSAESTLVTVGHIRTCTQLQNTPYVSPSRVAARSVGTLPTLPEHRHFDQHKTAFPRTSSFNQGSVEVVRSRPNVTLSSHHRLHLNTTQSANPIVPYHSRPSRREALDCPQALRGVSCRSPSSTLSLPGPNMTLTHGYHVESDSLDHSTAIEYPHLNISPSSQKDSILSLRTAKKALRIRTAEKKADQKEKERAKKAAKKTEKENADAAKRAGREQKEAAEKMRRLEKEAEKQRSRREEQAADMKKKRTREEEKERVAELGRHKRALEGLSRGFDPGAGMRGNRDAGNGHDETTAVEDSGGHGASGDIGSQKARHRAAGRVAGAGPGGTS